jgi:hypothetical protein
MRAETADNQRHPAVSKGTAIMDDYRAMGAGLTRADDSGAGIETAA